MAVALAVLAGCSAQAGTLTPSLPASTPPVSASPATPAPASPVTPIPSATETAVLPALPAVVSPALVRIDFQDDNNGWGIAVNANGYVLRSLDGGSSWLNATPPGIARIGLSANLTVLDTNTAWVLVPGTDFFSGTLYRTSDGGMTWSSNSVPFGGALMQFLDNNHGFALADRGTVAGSEAVELFQTTNGGASWTSIFHDNPGQGGASGSLPLAGIKNGMTFIDNQTGWVTGSIPQDGQVYLYVTRDGGISWSQQSVALPAVYQVYQYLVQAPVFFGKNAFLPLTIYLPDRTVQTFYTSQDGGASWMGDPAEAGNDILPGLFAFSDGAHAYSWDGGSSIYITNDGAQTWTAVATNLNLSGNLAQMEFAPFTDVIPVGWALTRVDEAGHSQLYHSTDGLQWKALIP